MNINAEQYRDWISHLLKSCRLIRFLVFSPSTRPGISTTLALNFLLKSNEPYDTHVAGVISVRSEFECLLICLHRHMFSGRDLTTLM
jgi:hypothetical protein